eukprot:PhF_6_TR15639/c0_g1_i1/m.24279
MDPDLERFKQRVHQYKSYLTTNPTNDVSIAPGITMPKSQANRKERATSSERTQNSNSQQQQHHHPSSSATSGAQNRSKSLVDTPNIGTRYNETEDNDAGGDMLIMGEDMDDDRRGRGDDGAPPLRVCERSRRWARMREENLAKQRAYMEEVRLKECSFVPQSKGAVHFAELQRAIATEADNPKAPGVSDFVNRQKNARQQQQEAQKRGVVDTSNWKNRATRPQEFNLGKQRLAAQHMSKFATREFEEIRAQLFAPATEFAVSNNNNVHSTSPNRFRQNGSDRQQQQRSNNFASSPGNDESVDREFEPSVGTTPSELARENQELRRILGEKELTIHKLNERIRALESKR